MRERDVASSVSTEKCSEFVAAVRVIDRLACCRVAKRLLDGRGHGRTTASLGSEPRRRLSQLPQGLLNSAQCRLFPQNLQSFEQWRRILAAADGDANWLEHLSGFQTEFLSRCPEGLVQRIMLEFDVG